MHIVAIHQSIQPFAALHSERAADSGSTVTPIPLAMAAVSVEIESISPMILAVRRRRENASSTRTRTALSNFRLPYITITPTFSICPRHGYLAGEHEFCPKCDEELLAQRGQAH